MTGTHACLDNEMLYLDMVIRLCYGSEKDAQKKTVRFEGSSILPRQITKKDASISCRPMQFPCTVTHRHFRQVPATSARHVTRLTSSVPYFLLTTFSLCTTEHRHVRERSSKESQEPGRPGDLRFQTENIHSSQQSVRRVARQCR